MKVSELLNILVEKLPANLVQTICIDPQASYIEISNKCTNDTICYIKQGMSYLQDGLQINLWNVVVKHHPGVEKININVDENKLAEVIEQICTVYNKMLVESQKLATTLNLIAV